MEWKGLIAGLVLGAGAVGVAWQTDNRPSTDKDRAWVLPDYQFMTLPNDDPQSIYVTGTIMVKGVGYRNNTWNIFCSKGEMICHTADVEEIGRDKLGEISTDDWRVDSWSPHLIVAVADADKSACSKATITINLDAKAVSYTRLPQNQAADYCQKRADPHIYNWAFGTAPRPWDM